MLVATVASTAGCVHTPPPVTDKVAQYYSNPPKPKAVKTPAALAPTVALLKDPKRAWSIGVPGDSTGNGPDEWVYLLAKDLSAKYDRPVIIHNWDIEKNRYADTTTIGGGAGAPVTIWNGSASGKGLTYSFEHREAMLPSRPDLVIVNHGHNMATPQEARVGAYNLVDWATNAWDKPPAVAVTLQNPRVDGRAATHAAVVAELREQWTGTPVKLIDVEDAYKSAPDVAALVREDGFHPNPKGEVVWAEAVKRALGV